MMLDNDVMCASRLVNIYGLPAEVDLQQFRGPNKREYLVIITDNFVSVVHKNLCCDPTFEPFQRDCAGERSQHMVNKKNIP